jgi:hypothetical protein
VRSRLHSSFALRGTDAKMQHEAMLARCVAHTNRLDFVNKSTQSVPFKKEYAPHSPLASMLLRKFT